MSRQQPLPPKPGEARVRWEHYAETVREDMASDYFESKVSEWELVVATRHEKEEQCEGVAGHRAWVKVAYVTLFWKRRVGG